MKRTIFLTGAALLSAALLTACSSTDVVYKYAVKSFDALLAASPSIVSDNTAVDHYYTISVDGSAKLLVSNDYAATGSDDLVLKTPLKPFTDAGLDPAKLPAGYRAEDGNLLLTADFGSGRGTSANVSDALFESVAADPDALTYHTALDHFGIKLPGGKFEFAKDYKKNDKDVVYVIAAKPLADLGVDVKNVSGWVFKTMKDESGKDVDVLLKPFDLK